MGIKRYKPTSSARRFMTVSSFEEITCTTPERSLLEDQKHKAGRNAQGKITVRHHGGGNKRKYRIIDFKRDRDGIPAIVKTIEYDPNRTANIALLVYADDDQSCCNLQNQVIGLHSYRTLQATYRKDCNRRTRHQQQPYLQPDPDTMPVQ